MPSADERPLRRVLAETGFEVLTVAGSAIRNEGTLFDEIARALELGDDFGRNWDALTDALGELEERPSARIAILWVDADQSLAADLQTFLGAVLAFDHAAADLGSITGEGEAPRQVEVFLLGSGAGFPSVR
jgi:RNAse (barnase) inhibitor barstar